mgnify:FL=1|jgi:hypothetical protein
MKKIVLYIYIFLMFFNVSKANNDLSGVQFECSIGTHLYEYIEFLSDKNVSVWTYIPSQFYYGKSNYYYKSSTKYVEFYWNKNLDIDFKYPSVLNRKTLKYGSFNCKIIEGIDIKILDIKSKKNKYK